MTAPGPTVDHPRVRAWLEIREPLERQLEPLGRAAIAALQPRPGERVLDVGCGIGATPRDLARAVGPSGRVVGLDLLQAAVDVARNDPDVPESVTFICADAQSYPFEPQSFDAVFSRFGTMFFAEPVAAFENIRWALRPGGRLGFVCWRGLRENQLDELPLRAAAPHLPAELVAGVAASDWFSFSEQACIRRVLARAGFVAVTIAPHDEDVRSGDLPSTVAVCSRVGALGKILRDHPQFRSEAVHALEQALCELGAPDGPALRAATWIVTAHAPG